ncbi:MAG: lipid asymmetry maintenance protein MlaB [Acidimicrobiia bacterium]
MAGVLNTAERVPPTDVSGSAAPGSGPAAVPDHPTRFALPPVADIREVGEILARCRGALEAEGDVTVDCGAVERVDAAGLQCLGALNASLAEAGRLLTLASPTAELRRAIEVLGFEALLGLGPAAGSAAPG